MTQHQVTLVSPFTPRRILRLLELASGLHRFKHVVDDATAHRLEQEADIEALAVGLGLLNPVGEAPWRHQPKTSGRASR